MKTLNKIPTRKVERAGRLIRTGAKIGRNYVKYYGNRIVQDEQKAKEQLNNNNAGDIYDELKQLKGSALKVAQMLSMEKGILPEAYVEKFSLSQFSVPPLSGALVKKTFRKYFGKNPEQLFDTFSSEAMYAATIGQVHQAEKDGKLLAVKIQYPGVRESISADLKMVKPVAMKMFNIQKKGSEKYFKEVENKLFEETDYQLELKRSRQFVRDCHHLPNLLFPQYYPKYSCDKILTMDWMKGLHFSEFIKKDQEQAALNLLGQTLWDFYMYQIHVLRRVHADPHPGNFLISGDYHLMVIDFGCIKEIPDNFYRPYFLDLAGSRSFEDQDFFEKTLMTLDVLKPEDTSEEKEFFVDLYGKMLQLFLKPINDEVFDFSNDHYFREIAELGQQHAKLEKIRSIKTARGSEHFIYINRTFFGLYNMMHALQAEGIKVKNYKNFIPEESFPPG